jgi:hypothetical protein
VQDAVLKHYAAKCQKILICEQHSESSLLATIVCLQQQNESSFVATISLPSKCGVAYVTQSKLYELKLYWGTSVGRWIDLGQPFMTAPLTIQFCLLA